MKTRTFYFFILLLPCIMFGQNGHGPDVVIPVRDGDADFAELHYFDGRTYHCEQWVDNYMWYYQSNYSKEFDLVPPSIRYSQLKKIANDEQAALFHFELLNPRSFVHGTPDYVVEDFLINYDSLRNHQPDYYDEYLEERLLPFSGIVMPNKLRDKEMINVTIDVTHPIYDIIENIELRDETHTVIGILNSRNPVFPTYIKSLKDLFITIHLTNGYEYNFYLKDEDCVLRPPVEEVDYVGPELPPPPPVTDPPIEPETDDDCNLKPTYYNHPVTGEPYTATIHHPTPDKILGYKTVSRVLSYTTTLPPEVIFETVNIPIYNPYTTDLNRGVYGEYGLIKTAVYKNPFHETVQNPIIITDGIDFLSNRGFDKMFEKFGGNQTIQTLWDGGYDVILADFAGGADFIQRNGYALIELLRSLKQDEGIDEIPAIIGPSMGGQVVRHALLFWENHLTGLYGPHNVKVFLSADSPWAGANASPAITAFALQKKDEDRISAEINNSANAPAARQLILHHTYTQLENNKQKPLNYDGGEHYYKSLFDSELITLGSVPNGVEKLISIADGASNGISSNVAPSEKIFNLRFTTDNFILFGDCVIWINFNAIESYEVLLNAIGVPTLPHALICAALPFSMITNVESSNFVNEFDSCPGSPFELEKYLTGFSENQTIYNKSGIRIKLKEVDEGDPFTFIPTFSAIGLTSDQLWSDFEAMSSKSNLGYVVPGSPFDYVWFDNINSSHNDFSQPGSIEFLLSHIEYQPIYESSCLIRDPDPINLNFENSFANFYCLFSGLIEIVSISNNNCNISVHNLGNSIGFKATPHSQDCSENIEVCFIPEGCSENICKEFEISVQGFGHPMQLESHKNPEKELDHIAKHKNSDPKLFPNPSTGIFFCSIPKSDYKQLKIYDLMGELIYISEFDSIIDLSHLSNGIYNVIFSNKGETQTLNQRILIVK